MATFLNLLDDLRDRLNDVADSQVPLATKKRFINHGIQATWPSLYRIVRDDTEVLVADTYEYDLPASVGNNSKILRVEIETAESSGRFVNLYDYQIVPGITDPILILEHASLPSEVGAKIRFTVARHLTELVNDNDIYDGPAGTEELPVLYATGLSMQRRLDDRIDHTRLSVTNGQNGVGPTDIMTASQSQFAQFELLLERMAMPLPSEQG